MALVNSGASQLRMGIRPSAFRHCVRNICCFQYSLVLAKTCSFVRITMSTIWFSLFFYSCRCLFLDSVGLNHCTNLLCPPSAAAWKICPSTRYIKKINKNEEIKSRVRSWQYALHSRPRFHFLQSSQSGTSQSVVVAANAVFMDAS